MARPFIIIPNRPDRPEAQSAIAAMRTETEADAVKEKQLKNLIKKANKIGVSEDAMNALRAEYNPYFYLHMTQAELGEFKEQWQKAGFAATDANITEYGVNFTDSYQYVIGNVEDPAAALQTALDAIKETVLFTGAIEIEYLDNQEIKFLDVRRSVVTLVDEYPR